MRYLVRARVKPGLERALLEAIERGTLGAGSVAEGEERPYWEEYFELVRVVGLWRLRQHRPLGRKAEEQRQAIPHTPAQFHERS